MTMLIQEPSISRQIIRQRRELGIDGRDEIWDGVYVVTPLANLEHQDLVGALLAILFQVVCVPKRGRVQPGANVSDRKENWKENFRIPDLVVALNESNACDCGTHWFGGPDFLVEVISPEESYQEEKRAFYERIGVRELLTVNRDTRHLALYRSTENALALTGQSDSSNSSELDSMVLPLSFRWTGTEQAPRTKVDQTDGDRNSWLI